MSGSTAQRQPEAIKATHHRNRRNRKDVLGLTYANEAEHSSLLLACQRLARAGFNVSQCAPEHWIIRGRTPLPEFHCYSESEIQCFTAAKTRPYQL